VDVKVVCKVNHCIHQKYRDPNYGNASKNETAYFDNAVVYSVEPDQSVDAGPIGCQVSSLFDARLTFLRKVSQGSVRRKQVSNEVKKILKLLIPLFLFTFATINLLSSFIDHQHLACSSFTMINQS
jgi:hypothetical protein